MFPKLFLLLALLCRVDSVASRQLLQGTGYERVHYIAAETLQWDYAPGTVNQCYQRPYTAEEASYTTGGLGTTYLKALYVGYTDSTFTHKLARNASEAHLGILGPLIRAVAGDTIVVHLLNRVAFPVTFIPSGLNNSAAGSAQVAAPGQLVIYQLSVPAEAAPGPEEDASSKLWLYRSLLTQQTDADSGLVGPIIVSKASVADSDGSPSDVDVEFVTLFQVFNEENSPLIEANQALFAGNTMGGLSADDFTTFNLKHTINGFLFCGLKGLTAAVGNKVRWHIATVGNEVDVHTVHFHGSTLVERGRHHDSFRMLPSVIRTTDLIADNPGTWLLHCHVNAHFHSGMIATYNVTGTRAAFNQTGTTRKYYVQAEEHLWDYAPDNGDSCSGTTSSWSNDALPYVTGNSTRIGRTYIKALFVEYTDATFSVVKARSAEEEHLGSLGPTLRAEVGDTIQVVFRNRARFPSSMHPHGVLYDKASEGSPYSDGTSGVDKLDDAVPSNGNHTYVWHVPERAGPGPSDPSSVMWMYHGHTAEAGDTYAGLMGAIIISRTGAAAASGLPNDVDREFVLFFGVIDEGSSLLFWRNLINFLPDMAGGINSTTLMQPSDNEAIAGSTTTSSTNAQLQALIEDPLFVEANMMYSINGRIYCNLKGLNAKQGERVRLYVMSLGTEADVHTPGATSVSFELGGQQAETITSLPGIMDTADTLLSQAGTWILRCHTALHTTAGMQALFTVEGSNSATAAALLPAAAQSRSSLLSALAFMSQALSGIFSGIGGGAPTTRTYYIEAEEGVWDYSPSNQFMCGAQPRAFQGKETLYTEAATNTLGPKAMKARYVGHTSATFSTRVVQPLAHGLLGPLISAEVGDVVEIVFRNSLPNGVNLVLNGGLIPDSASYITAAVAPGTTVTQRWTVPGAAGPAPLDLTTVAHTYSSTINPVSDYYSGLIGISMISTAGQLSPDGQVKGVDQVVPALFAIWDEAQSPYFGPNIDVSLDPNVDVTDPNFIEGNLKHAINGYVYCNMPEVTVTEGQTVRWLLVGMGTDNDMHTPIFINQVVTQKGVTLDAMPLLSGTTSVVDMIARSPGTYIYQCDVQDHNVAGMRAHLKVLTAK